MNRNSKSFASTAAAVTLVSAIGIAYAQSSDEVTTMPAEQTTTQTTTLSTPADPVAPAVVDNTAITTTTTTTDTTTPAMPDPALTTPAPAEDTSITTERAPQADRN